jgi:hypothetical protein
LLTGTNIVPSFSQWVPLRTNSVTARQEQLFRHRDQHPQFVSQLCVSVSRWPILPFLDVRSMASLVD